MSWKARRIPLKGESEWIEFENEEDAILYARENARFGSLVKNDADITVYAPEGELAAEILYKAKQVCDYVRDEEFCYGNAPINPAMNHDAKLVSCDRMVGWVLYNMGLTDQPEYMGLCVECPVLHEWCFAHGFKKIEKLEDVRARDVVFVRYTHDGYPAHTFISAGASEQEGMFYRYDCGKVERIRSTQPSCEPTEDFLFAARMPEIPKK